MCLYTSDIVDGKIKSEYKLINVQDNKDLLESDQSAQSYQDKMTSNVIVYGEIPIVVSMQQEACLKVISCHTK